MVPSSSTGFHCMPSSHTTEEIASAALVDVLDAFRAHHPDGNVEVLRRAYEVAEEAHAGQVRKTGHPFITHPLMVAYMLAIEEGIYPLDRPIADRVLGAEQPEEEVACLVVPSIESRR